MSGGLHMINRTLPVQFPEIKQLYDFVLTCWLTKQNFLVSLYLRNDSCKNQIFCGTSFCFKV